MTSYDYIAMAAILLIGVPHGGLDGAVARRIGWPMSPWGWITFHLDLYPNSYFCYGLFGGYSPLLVW
jgi:hypothetical protein